ncbi:hypothetical protein MTsPCn9_33040 [Croceitalea sp. MTPC9]|nr:hypothetical protein MTsPCn6_33340 [Croceitalea sp. MTPC6]GMN18364.1 hypothetical protein MTsPCn9_33040 [Croceitalea sp. MTPC9]
MFITSLSLFSFPELDNDTGIRIPYADKIAHFIFYFVFVVLGFFFLQERRVKPSFKPLKTTYKIMVVAIIYGILIEGLQYIMPFDRAAEFFDVLANSAGAIFGGLLIKSYLSLIKKLK